MAVSRHTFDEQHKTRALRSREESRTLEMRCSTSSFILTLIISISLWQVTSSCLVSLTEHVTIADTNVSIRCNARPNSEPHGSITNLKLGSEGPTGILIYQPAVYNPRGELSVTQFIADGYSLSHSANNRDLFDVTIGIKDTQLKHGDKYFCSCAGSTSSVASMKLDTKTGLGDRPTEQDLGRKDAQVASSEETRTGGRQTSELLTGLIVGCCLIATLLSRSSSYSLQSLRISRNER